MAILFCWLVLTVIITAIGFSLGNSKLMITGAVMVMLLACVAGID